MSVWLFLAIALAGGLGAVCRFMVDGAISWRRAGWPSGGALPRSTILINVSGSLLLGFLAGIATAHAVPHGLQLVAGTGFLGGYTTFSTASVETVRLLQEREYGAALVNGLGVALVAILAAGAGLWLGVGP